MNQQTSLLSLTYKISKNKAMKAYLLSLNSWFTLCKKNSPNKF
jgi:hypothetical protein